VTKQVYSRRVLKLKCKDFRFIFLGYGIDNYGQIDTNGKFRIDPSIKIKWNDNSKHIIDMKMDFIRNELSFCTVNGHDTYTITGIPSNSFVPHFNLYNQNTEIRVWKINPDSFGLDQ